LFYHAAFEGLIFHGKTIKYVIPACALQGFLAASSGGMRGIPLFLVRSAADMVTGIDGVRSEGAQISAPGLPG